MPELPEVETTVRYLRAEVIGRSISAVTVRWKRTIDRPSSRQFEKSVLGSTFVSVERRGKFIVMNLRDAGGESRALLAHLRMSGSFDVVSTKAERDRHDHIILNLDDGREVRFNDPRKFGRFYLVDDINEVTGKLGPEPLGDEFSIEVLSTRLRERKGAIKPLLLDQSVVAGLGNIYVDESLWRAGIHPLTSAARVNAERSKLLFTAIREVLLEAIETAGTDYGDGVVDGGMYRPRVYAREGEPCERCESLIRRIVVGQRGTHLCRRCQPSPRGRRR